MDDACAEGLVVDLLEQGVGPGVDFGGLFGLHCEQGQVVAVTRLVENLAGPHVYEA